jgi:hypothetical protein
MRKKKGEECGVFEKWNAHPLFSQILRSLFFEKKEKKKTLGNMPSNYTKKLKSTNP